MKNWITHNWGLKIIALGLALITWIYVKNELVRYRASTYTGTQQQSAR